MTSIATVLAAALILAVSGLPALFFDRHSPAGQRLTVLLAVLGGGTGLIGSALALGAPGVWRRPWLLPWGEFAVGVDAISAVFLAPVFGISMLGAIYALGYWPQAEHPGNGRRLGAFYGLLAGAMAMVVIARDGVLFLIVWELMALAAYFAATVDEDDPEVCRAGWIYLVATHLGTLLLIALFALWNRHTGLFALEPAAAMPVAAAGALFVLAVAGFGFKAGFMPLHVWLPGAHAGAPSHVSAVMSAVMLKMGVYGIVRITSLLPVTAPWWGWTLLIVGAAGGLGGIIFALAQHDLKRLLAYSSIENLGIVAMGLGLALLGRASGRADLVLLGLGGALLHVWNHAMFKALLFFGAGAVIHATHTRDMNRLGGLGRRLPRLGFCFAVGTAAICALPPLNGFVGEWLLYRGLFRTLEAGGAAPAQPAAALAAVALALIGALALACFVKLLGGVFLGAPRQALPNSLHEPPASMLLPMALLAAGCLAVGLWPGPALGVIRAAVEAWVPGDAKAAVELVSGVLAPLRLVTAGAALLLALAGGLYLAVGLGQRRRPAGRAVTWDCGYARPQASMQYTPSSFAQSLAGLAQFVLWPRTLRPALRGLFPGRAEFRAHTPDTVLDRLALPFMRFTAGLFTRLRVLQQGQTHLYLLYILIITIFLLAWGGWGRWGGNDLKFQISNLKRGRGREN